MNRNFFEEDQWMDKRYREKMIIIYCQGNPNQDENEMLSYSSDNGTNQKHWEQYVLVGMQ